MIKNITSMSNNYIKIKVKTILSFSKNLKNLPEFFKIFQLV